MEPVNMLPVHTHPSLLPLFGNSIELGDRQGGCLEVTKMYSRYVNEVTRGVREGWGRVRT